MTVVTPIEKAAGGCCDDTTSATTPLSDAVGAVHITLAVEVPLANTSLTSTGQLDKLGGMVSGEGKIQ